MDLRDYVRAIRRRWWLVLAAVVAALGVAALATAATTPQYATSVTFFVTTPSQGVTDSYQGGLFSQQRVKSYSALLTGDRLARSVAGEAGSDLAPAAIQARVSAKVVSDTVLLQATVTDSDPARSERVAAAVAKHFVSLVESLETPPGATTPAVKVEVVAGPLLNPVPVSPQGMRNLVMAAMLGLLLGVAAAVLRETLDVTIKTAETVGEVTGAPVLAVVPFDKSAKQAPLVFDTNAHSPRAEAFRHLRTNLQFVDVDRPVKVIVITSAVPDEGKSTTSVNLAIAFAEAGQRVLLIEADMRRPRLAHYLGVEGAMGLSNVLAGQADVDDVLQRWGRHELDVLPSGSVPPNPSELLGSRNMVILLARLRDTFDVVIIDTPPLLPVTDAAVVAAVADGAVLITRSGRTSQARVRMAVASLRGVDSRVLGCVLNMQATKGQAADYYYDYAYRGDVSTRGRPAAKKGALSKRASAAPDDFADLKVKSRQ